jgi:hypothetical protein
MKALRTAILLLLPLLGLAQFNFAPDSSRAMVVLFRDKGTDPFAFTQRHAYSIWVNNRKMGQIEQGRYVAYQVPPGEVRVRAGRRGLLSPSRNELRLTAEAGNIYYIAYSPRNIRTYLVSDASGPRTRCDVAPRRYAAPQTMSSGYPMGCHFQGVGKNG